MAACGGMTACGVVGFAGAGSGGGGCVVGGVIASLQRLHPHHRMKRAIIMSRVVPPTAK